MQLPQTSFQGRPLTGVEISKNVKRRTRTAGRSSSLVGEHHAREWPSSEAAMEFAIMLAQGYGNNKRITQLLDRARVVVVPKINPDGFISSRDWPADPADILGGGGRNPTDRRGQPGPRHRSRPEQSVQRQPDWACRRTVRGDPHLRGERRTDDGLRRRARPLSGRGRSRLRRHLRLPAQELRRRCIPNPSVPCELQHGVDPNRNYGKSWGGPGSGEDRTSQSYRGTGPWSEPETQAVTSTRSSARSRR